MRLDIKMLDPTSTLNDIEYINELEVYPGETTTVMFQIVNKSNGIRYIPDSGAIVTVKLYSVNDVNNITKTATNPFVDDRSIWSFNLNAVETQKMAGVNMELTITEGTQIKKIWAQSVIIVYPRTPYKA